MKSASGVCCSIVFVAIWVAPSFCHADQTEDEATIRKNAEDYVAAYNNHDAKALAAMWSPGAVYMDVSTGEAAVGREEIENVFSQTLAEFKNAKLQVDVKTVDFVSPNVAIENGTVRVIRPDADPEETDYMAVNVRQDGKWFIDRISEESPSSPPPSNYEHLRELEWMIGSWIDQSEDATIQTDCQWTKNQNFINRSFAVVVGDQVDMAVMQIIGWDPVAKQIRSWAFDSDGGFAEGKWTRNGDRWVIQQNGTLPNGSRSSAVNVMAQIDDDSFTWQSIQREIDGDVLPNVDEVLIVRQPAE
jgi:uncharacterized protein (TIGR02246 family)